MSSVLNKKNKISVIKGKLIGRIVLLNFFKIFWKILKNSTLITIENKIKGKQNGKLR